MDTITSQKIKQGGIISILPGDFSVDDYARAKAKTVGLGSKLILDRQQPTEDPKARTKVFRQAWKEARNG
jgi:hypothetical protein